MSALNFNTAAIQYINIAVEPNPTFREMSEIDRKSLAEALNYLQQGNISQVNNRLNSISPEFHAHPEVMDLRHEVCVKTSDWESALKLATALATVSPKNRGYWLKLAQATRQTHGIQPAYEALQRAQFQIPEDLEIHYQLACYAAEMGEATRARNWLKLAFVLVVTPSERQALELRIRKEPVLGTIWTVPQPTEASA